MANRDDFSEPTKRYVAHRAGYRCSFRGCPQVTAGPSDESKSAMTNVGEAAHICAASPGGKRHVPTMTREERQNIDNAIWMCSTHARLIDRDEALYTIEGLREMKREHEAACAEEVRRPSGSTWTYGLIAVGPDIVCTGELVGINGSEWSVYVQHFITGNLNGLIAFTEKFPHLSRSDQYLLVNQLGDGRVLTKAPTIMKSERGYVIACQVAASFERINAKDLGSQWAISPLTNDLYIENGQLARVSGLASLPQKVQSCLSMQRGEWFFAPGYGVRFAEYLDAYRDSPWLGHFVMLDVVRQSAIRNRPVRAVLTGSSDL